MSDKKSVLLVDPDATSQKLIAQTFNRVGWVCRFVREPQKTVGALRVLQPNAVMIHGELGTAGVNETLESMASDVAFAKVPVVVLCSNVQDARWLANFRAGVVALLAKPFSPQHVEQVRQILSEVPERSGRLVGQGDRAELTAVVDHLRRARRSGVLWVNPLTPSEGKAFFAGGTLKSAQHAERSGSAALSSMLAQPKASWTFSEVGEENSAVVIEFGADQPQVSLDDNSQEGVSIDLDIAEEELLLEDVVEEPAPKPAPPGAPTPILLVDDDPELRRMFGLYFKKHGFDVQSAEDGLAGFELAVKGPFEAIVADLNMPRMDGWGLLRMVRDDFRTRESVVAFLSCHDDYRESLKALDAGAQAYFSKSNKLDALVIQVRELLEPRIAFRKAAAAAKPFQVALGTVGAQFSILELCRTGKSGTLTAKDNWATYELAFGEGRILQAKSQSGRHLGLGDKALANYIASRAAQGTVAFGPPSTSRNVQGTPEEALARCAATLNGNERNLQDGLMVAGRSLQVDAELYKLYSQVGPKHWLEIARLLCEEKLSPRTVLERTNVSPIEVEEAVRDLIRRGVIQLSA